MYNLLEVLPFGFVFELVNETCHFSQGYELYLDGQLHSTDNRNVVSVFDLKPSKQYAVELRFADGETLAFRVTTGYVNYVINVRDYNATGDGVTDDTAAIAMAIYAAPEAESVIYFPPGEYLVDQILLRSYTDIYLARGAVLKQSFARKKLAIIKAYQKNRKHTAVQVNSSWEGHPIDTYASLIYGNQVSNVRIYGAGVIDGNGDIGGFWENPKVKNIAFRPKNIFFTHSAYISVLGVTSRNSASWNIHPFYSDHVRLIDVKVQSVEVSPNTDGIDPESCTQVDIIGCHFSVGDDCIAIKSGKYYMAAQHLRPTRQVTIRNCFMEKGHGAVVIGSEIACGVSDVSVSQCLFQDTDRGLRIKTRRGRGETSVVERLSFDNVQMVRVKHGFVVNMFYHCDPDGRTLYVKDKTVTEKDAMTPTIRDITLNNVHATDLRSSAVFIYGLPENPVTGITATNCHFGFAPDRETYPYPAMMCDFEPIENLGVFIANGQYTETNTTYDGQYTLKK